MFWIELLVVCGGAYLLADKFALLAAGFSVVAIPAVLLTNLDKWESTNFYGPMLDSVLTGFSGIDDPDDVWVTCTATSHDFAWWLNITFWLVCMALLILGVVPMVVMIVGGPLGAGVALAGGGVTVLTLAHYGKALLVIGLLVLLAAAASAITLGLGLRLVHALTYLTC